MVLDRSLGFWSLGWHNMGPEMELLIGWLAQGERKANILPLNCFYWTVYLCR
jgi:hypothetical protein